MLGSPGIFLAIEEGGGGIIDFFTPWFQSITTKVAADHVVRLFSAFVFCSVLAGFREREIVFIFLSRSLSLSLSFSVVIRAVNSEKCLEPNLSLSEPKSEAISVRPPAMRVYLYRYLSSS